jgi:hypothetical protein
MTIQSQVGIVILSLGACRFYGEPTGSRNVRIGWGEARPGPRPPAAKGPFGDSRVGSSRSKLVSRVGAVHQPDHSELEQAILQYLGSQPPGAGRGGTLHVKVTELERVTDPPDSSQLRGGLFLSVPFVGADRTKLDQALARVRKGFKRDEILRGWHVELIEEKPYSHRDDELDGMALLTLPAVLTLEPRS